MCFDAVSLHKEYDIYFRDTRFLVCTLPLKGIFEFVGKYAEIFGWWRLRKPKLLWEKPALAPLIFFHHKFHVDQPGIEHVSSPFFFFFNRHCNPCEFWPAQISLSIPNRKVFTECRCQRHVKPPNLEDQWLERSNSRHQVSTTSETTRARPSSGRWNYGQKIAENFAESGDFHLTFRFLNMP